MAANTYIGSSIRHQPIGHTSSIASPIVQQICTNATTALYHKTINDSFITETCAAVCRTWVAGPCILVGDCGQKGTTALALLRVQEVTRLAGITCL